MNISAWSLSAVRARSARIGAVLSLAAAVLGAGGCGSATIREGTGSSYLVLVALEGRSGAMGDGAPFSTSALPSDVLTFIKATNTWTIFSDAGRATFRLAMKDVGNPAGPSENNSITLNRYRVVYRRTDGRNAPGTEVPYGFDSAITVTIGGGDEVQVPFEIVRVQAKQEAPLAALAVGGGARDISTIADVTFYGRDQTGREVAVSGSIAVNFANWGDPAS